MRRYLVADTASLVVREGEENGEERSLIIRIWHEAL